MNDNALEKSSVRASETPDGQPAVVLGFAGHEPVVMPPDHARRFAMAILRACGETERTER